MSRPSEGQLWVIAMSIEFVVPTGIEPVSKV